MDNYIPPFDITNIMLDRISSIMKKVGKLDNYKDLNKMPVLRRNNRIRSIHSSLAIEANSLSFDQVKDIIDGKKVIGPQDEIQEVYHHPCHRRCPGRIPGRQQRVGPQALQTASG